MKPIIPFDSYEVHGCRSFQNVVEQVDDELAQFWSLYGRIPGQGLECIGDFKSREIAEEVRCRITGRKNSADFTGAYYEGYMKLREENRELKDAAKIVIEAYRKDYEKRFGQVDMELLTCVLHLQRVFLKEALDAIFKPQKEVKNEK